MVLLFDNTPNGIVNSSDRGTAFRPGVPFACCDVGQGPIMVVLRVEDQSGNVNTCMVEITVQDKIGPFYHMSSTCYCEL